MARVQPIRLKACGVPFGLTFCSTALCVRQRNSLVDIHADMRRKELEW